MLPSLVSLAISLLAFTKAAHIAYARRRQRIHEQATSRHTERIALSG